MTMAEHRRRAAETKRAVPLNLLRLQQEFPTAAELQVPVTTPWAVPSASGFPHTWMRAEMLLWCALGCWEHQTQG